MGWERVADALRGRGFTVTCPLPQASGIMQEGQEIFWCQLGDLRLTIHKDAVGQLLHELVDVDRYASAIKEIARRATLRGGHTWRGAMTFSNEKAIWRMTVSTYGTWWDPSDPDEKIAGQLNWQPLGWPWLSLLDAPLTL